VDVVEGIVVVDAVDSSEDVVVPHGWDLVVVVVVNVVGLLWLCGSEAAASFVRMAFDGLLGLGEMFVTVAAVRPGYNTNFLFLTALYQVGFVGKPSVAWWYRTSSGCIFSS
jgi:hypothetical protein